MKTIPALLAALALLAGPAVTAEEGGKPDGEGHRKHEQREDILKKFDADGDGKLNEAERTTARAALTEKMKKDHPEAFARADKDGDGSLSEEEFDTVAGRVMKQVGRLPRRGETIIISDLEFRVLRADRRRVEAFKVIPPNDVTPIEERGGGD